MGIPLSRPPLYRTMCLVCPCVLASVRVACVWLRFCVLSRPVMGASVRVTLILFKVFVKSSQVWKRPPRCWQRAYLFPPPAPLYRPDAIELPFISSFII